VHHEIAVIEENPPAFPDPLDPQRPHAVLAERLLDMMGHGRNLPVGRPRAQQEEVGEGGAFPDVERADIGGLFLLGQPGALQQRLLRRYGRCSSARLM
jgi:hypothetical protein